MEIYLIRHTPVAVGRSGCYGQLDVDLAPTFEEDYLPYREQLPLDTFDRVYCSPLSRCRRLAAALGIETYTVEERLIELSFGDWEGTEWKALPPEELNGWMADFVRQAPPGGESFQALYDRFADFLTELGESDAERVLLIAHAGIIRCAWSYLLDIPLVHLFRLPIGFGEILQFELSPTPGRTRIIRKV